MIGPEQGTELSVAIGNGQADEIVGVEEIERFGAQIEEREDTGVNSYIDVGMCVQVKSHQREGLSEADTRSVLQVLVSKVIVVRGREVWPTGIGEEGQK